MTTTTVVRTKVTHSIFDQNLDVPGVGPTTTRIELSRIARSMDDLSPFEDLVLVLPSSSRENNLVRSTDNLTFDGTPPPSHHLSKLMATVTKQGGEIKDLQKDIKDIKEDINDVKEGIEDLKEAHKILEKRIQELDERVGSQLVRLDRIALRALIGAFLAHKGYRPSPRIDRDQWIVSHMQSHQLLPPTGITENEFLNLLKFYHTTGNGYTHKIQSLTIAQAVEAQEPEAIHELSWMFRQCLGHEVGDDIMGNISLALVQVARNGVLIVTRTAP